MPAMPLMMPTPEVLAAVKQEEMQQMVVHHNMLMNGGVHMGNGQVVAPPVPAAPIQFTDQQLTTISQAINATTTIPATSSVMDVGGGNGNVTASIPLQHMDTTPAGQGVNLMAPNCTASDIILNSHSAILGAPSDASAVVSSAVSSANGATSSIVGALGEHGSISPDIILNPTVTPSLLCDSVPVVVVVPTANSSGVDGNVGLLVDPLLSVSPITIDGSSVSGGGLQSPQSPNGSSGGVSTTAEVVQNVQNMILNAAAEILVSQQTTISNESMQAIISLNNAASMLNDQQQEQVVTPIYTSPPPAVAVEDPNLVLMVQQNSNILTEAQTTSQVAGGGGRGGGGVTGNGGLMGVSGDIHMQTVHEDIGHLAG